MIRNDFEKTEWLFDVRYCSMYEPQNTETCSRTQSALADRGTKNQTFIDSALLHGNLWHARLQGHKFQQGSQVAHGTYASFQFWYFFPEICERSFENFPRFQPFQLDFTSPQSRPSYLTGLYVTTYPNATHTFCIGYPRETIVHWKSRYRSKAS